jgi:methyl halide transferase
MELNKEYWDSRYHDETKPHWDAGEITTPLKEYFDQLTNKDVKILIPGCGNGHEAEYLFGKGFENICLLDWSDKALKDFSERNSDFPVQNLIAEDFFSHEGNYDLIIEQTFFCSLPYNQRKDYFIKINSLLNPGGKLAGVLFDYDFGKQEPPFGGSREEYLSYIKDLFRIRVFENCYNSIKPRSGRELFMILEKK